MWLNCFLLGGIRKIWLGLRCDNDNVIKSAIIMSIAWRLHCSKSLTFLAELYTCTKRSIWYVRLLLQSWKKFEMTEFLNFYATKHIIKFFTSCDIWKLGRQTVKLSSAVICCLEAQTANIAWSWRSSLHHHFLYDHDVELSCGLICLKKKERKIS